MNIEEAKKEVSEIIRKVIHYEDVYYLDGKFVRWGRVEKDLHAVLERLLTPDAADLLSRPACCASFVFDGTHHKDCRLAKSASG